MTRSVASSSLSLRSALMRKLRDICWNSGNRVVFSSLMLGNLINITYKNSRLLRKKCVTILARVLQI